MNEKTRAALMAAAWQALERSEGWNGSKEDFNRYWERLEPSMEAAIHNEAAKTKWDMRLETIQEFTIAALYSISDSIQVFLPFGALILLALCFFRLTG